MGQKHSSGTVNCTKTGTINDVTGQESNALARTHEKNEQHLSAYPTQLPAVERLNSHRL